MNAIDKEDLLREKEKTAIIIRTKEEKFKDWKDDIIFKKKEAVKVFFTSLMAFGVAAILVGILVYIYYYGINPKANISLKAIVFGIFTLGSAVVLMIGIIGLRVSWGTFRFNQSVQITEFEILIKKTTKKKN